MTADRILDITGEICPMTFVHTRLALDRLQSGQTLRVLLRGEEPVRNIPANAAAQGHTILAIEADEHGNTAVTIRKAPTRPA